MPKTLTSCARLAQARVKAARMRTAARRLGLEAGLGLLTLGCCAFRADLSLKRLSAENFHRKICEDQGHQRADRAASAAPSPTPAGRKAEGGGRAPDVALVRGGHPFHQGHKPHRQDFVILEPGFGPGHFDQVLYGV